jgi:T5SS/PEP-CTERM-associated repeat protein
MHRIRRGYLIAGFLVWIAVGSQPSEAQYAANFQTNIISGVTSNWPFSYTVGYTNAADVLLIQNGGVLSNGTGSLGVQGISVNNSVLVTDPGSIWSNLDDVYVGTEGSGNSLVISNGGRVVSGPLGQRVDAVGQRTSSSNNSVVVTGAGSVWDETVNSLTFGDYGRGNILLINQGGQVFASKTVVGQQSQSGSNNIVVTDVGSVWSNSGSLAFGYNSTGNSLVISNGASVIDSNGFIYSVSGITSNSVLVTGPRSTWNNSGTLVVGQGKGSGNSLSIADGGQVTSTYGYLLSTSNTVLVTASTWSNRNDLYLGQAGPGNSLLISNGGLVIDSTGYLGYNSGNGGASNSVIVASAVVLQPSAWRNNILYVGYLGSANSLMIEGGIVTATNVVIGAASTTCDNVLELDSGRLTVTNATGTGVLEVRHGSFILGGGVARADTLVITNSCASLVHTGGTLIVGNVVLDPNTFRIVSVARQNNDMLITWMMGPGATNTLQATGGDGSGGYSTNGFTDIFIVTNNTAIGTITNYLDIGAATNAPARYYRARLTL